jgi:hypothetical protein
MALGADAVLPVLAAATQSTEEVVAAAGEQLRAWSTTPGFYAALTVRRAALCLVASRAGSR